MEQPQPDAIRRRAKVPRILKAIRVAPVGRQAGLKPVHLLGKIRIDPNLDDFYKHVVEQKEAHKANATLKKGLKVRRFSANEQHDDITLIIAKSKAGE